MTHSPLIENGKHIVFLDYEGTLGTSLGRHYVQYVEALQRMRQSANLAEDALPLLSKEEFLWRYREVKHIGQMLDMGFGDANRILQRWLQAVHKEIVLENKPEHFLQEKLFPQVITTIRHLRESSNLAVVEFTRQSDREFTVLLKHMGLVGDPLIPEENVFTVGGAGPKAHNSKSSFLLDAFGDRIALAKERGKKVLLIGDSVSDMIVARDIGIQFLAVESGGTRREEFESHKNRINGADFRCIDRVGGEAFSKTLLELGVTD